MFNKLYYAVFCLSLLVMNAAFAQITQNDLQELRNDKEVRITVFSKKEQEKIKARFSDSIVNENITNNEHNEEDEQIVINIFSVGCPDYELTLETKDIEKGIDLLQKVMEHMIDESKSEEGMNLSIKTPPHTIGE